MNGENTSRNGTRIRFLIIDDDVLALALTISALKVFDYEVYTSRCPLGALSAIQLEGKTYEVILANESMSSMSSRKFQRMIEHEYQIPVILMSTNGKKNSMVDSTSPNAQYFIVTPPSVNDLQLMWEYINLRKRSWGIETPETVMIPNMELVTVPFTEANNSGPILHPNLTVQVDDPVIPVPQRLPTPSNSSENNGNGMNSNFNGRKNSKKPKISWTPSLHNKFLEAVAVIGSARAVPKKILEYMNMSELSRENVASHLQKYRIYEKRKKQLQEAIERGESIESLERRFGSSFMWSEFESENISLGNYADTVKFPLRRKCPKSTMYDFTRLEGSMSPTSSSNSSYGSPQGVQSMLNQPSKDNINADADADNIVRTTSMPNFLSMNKTGSTVYPSLSTGMSNLNNNPPSMYASSSLGMSSLNKNASSTMYPSSSLGMSSLNNNASAMYPSTSLGMSTLSNKGSGMYYPTLSSLGLSSLNYNASTMYSSPSLGMSNLNNDASSIYPSSSLGMSNLNNNAASSIYPASSVGLSSLNNNAASSIYPASSVGLPSLNNNASSIYPASSAGLSILNNNASSIYPASSVGLPNLNNNASSIYPASSVGLSSLNNNVSSIYPPSLLGMSNLNNNASSIYPVSSVGLPSLNNNASSIYPASSAGLPILNNNSSSIYPASSVGLPNLNNNASSIYPASSVGLPNLNNNASSIYPPSLLGMSNLNNNNASSIFPASSASMLNLNNNALACFNPPSILDTSNLNNNASPVYSPSSPTISNINNDDTDIYPPSPVVNMSGLNDNVCPIHPPSPVHMPDMNQNASSIYPSSPFHMLNMNNKNASASIYPSSPVHMTSLNNNAYGLNNGYTFGAPTSSMNNDSGFDGQLKIGSDFNKSDSDSNYTMEDVSSEQNSSNEEFDKDIMSSFDFTSASLATPCDCGLNLDDYFKEYPPIDDLSSFFANNVGVST